MSRSSTRCWRSSSSRCSLLGGEAGLIAGAILFQAASILDGVDGEMARATWRSSPAGATLDSVVDIATNLLFVSALTVNLALRDGGAIGWIGGLGADRLGARRPADRACGCARRRRAARLRSAQAAGGADGGLVDLVYWVVQVLTGRDCFAFLFMVLILAGLERTALIIYRGGRHDLVSLCAAARCSSVPRASSQVRLET